MKHFKTAFLGLMLSLMVVTTTLEAAFLALFLPPLVKPGFANIIVMFIVLAIGWREGFILNFMKAVFVLALRGPVAGLMSFSGGMLSILVIIILVTCISEKKVSFIALGVSGALFHNIGQLLTAAWLINITGVVYYIPTLIVAGTFAGVLTGTILRFLMPMLNRAHKFRQGFNKM